MPCFLAGGMIHLIMNPFTSCLLWQKIFFFLINVSLLINRVNVNTVKLTFSHTQITTHVEFSIKMITFQTQPQLMEKAFSSLKGIHGVGSKIVNSLLLACIHDSIVKRCGIFLVCGTAPNPTHPKYSAPE